MQVVFDGLLRGTCVHNRGRCFRSPPLPHATISLYPSSLGDENDFTLIHQSSLPHLRNVSIRLELRSLCAMSNNALLSVVSLLHSNKIATLPCLEELAYSCNGANIDKLRLPSTCPSGKHSAPEHILSGKMFRARLNVDIFHPERYLSNGIVRVISRNLSCRNPECCASGGGPLQVS